MTAMTVNKGIPPYEGRAQREESGTLRPAISHASDPQNFCRCYDLNAEGQNGRHEIHMLFPARSSFFGRMASAAKANAVLWVKKKAWLHARRD